MTEPFRYQDGISQDVLPPYPTEDPSIARAPVRRIDDLSAADRILAVSNALRYFPSHFHAQLAPEFAMELNRYGRIYMFRFRPEGIIRARPIQDYPARCPAAGAIMLMIENNLDPKVAKYPYELITYGGNGAVFQNWAQYRLTMQYLSQMEEDQTLVMYSGHPLGLFPSTTEAPLVVVTNGMMVPNYSSKEDWNRLNALGVTQYGQMTAGSFMYIGPQGIVHGTTITLLNAGRLCGFGEDLRGRLFVTSGLGGMSGAQSIAANIAGATCLIAEVDGNAVRQRMADGYIRKDLVFQDLDDLLDRCQQALTDREALTLVFHGNVVELWEYLAAHEVNVDLGSDQTSLHNIDDMGYCPVGYDFQSATDLMKTNKAAFQAAVQNTLKRHVAAINILADRGMYFWDYGNAFLKEAGEAGAEIWNDADKDLYRYPSYVEDIMGPMCFDYGFGPFRWVCTSSLAEELYETDRIAEAVLTRLMKDVDAEVRPQFQDNLKWIREARANIPLVGSMSRILYANAEGRVEIARAFNAAIREGRLTAPVVLGRDHHDVSGTDSPFRETADIYDGSRFTADMAVQNFVGDAFRGATWVSLHNGGGVGWGEAINGGFGLVLDGSDKSERQLEQMLYWDVMNGVSRRSWARNQGAQSTIRRAMSKDPKLQVTIPAQVDDEVIKSLF